MRAPPLEEKQISGRPLARQCSAPRVKRSPTTEPIEPPRKRNSNAQATTSMPCSAPAITIIASFSPTVFCAAVRRSRYFLLSRNLSGSSGSTSSASSRPVPSSRKPIEPVTRLDAHVVAALRADLQVALELGAVEHGVAGRALDPQAFGHGPRAALRLDARGDDLFEPGHGAAPVARTPKFTRRQAESGGVVGADEIQALRRRRGPGLAPVAPLQDLRQPVRRCARRARPGSGCPRCCAPCDAGRRWRAPGGRRKDRRRSTAMLHELAHGRRRLAFGGAEGGKVVVPDQRLRRFVHARGIEFVPRSSRRAGARAPDACADRGCGSGNAAPLRGGARENRPARRGPRARRFPPRRWRWRRASTHAGAARPWCRNAPPSRAHARPRRCGRQR